MHDRLLRDYRELYDTYYITQDAWYITKGLQSAIWYILYNTRCMIYY